MPLQPLSIAFPAGGVDNRNSFQEQPPYTTPSVLNVWPFDASSGRRRLGSRAGISTYPNISGVPYHWCPCNYQKNTGATATNVSTIAVASGAVASIHTSGGFATKLTGGTTGVTQSVAVYLQTLFYAGGSATIPLMWLPDSSIGDIASDFTTTTPFALTKQGTVFPTRCTLACAWGDRLLLSGDKQNSHIVYGCRISNFCDWDDAQVDPASSFATGDAFGLIHPPVSALIPVTQYILIIGGTDSMHTLRGNPSGGGSHGMISANVGPIRNSGWCQLDDGSILFMSRAGLYRTNGGPPQAVSKDKIPSELMGIGASLDDKVSLAYDTRWNGIHIVGLTDAGSTPFAFFHDLEKGGFWPMDFGSSFEPTLVASKPDEASTDSSNVILFKTSISKKYDSSVKDSADSHLIYGPIPVNGQFGEGVLQEITAVLGANSLDVNWCIYVGNSAQEAWTKVEKDSNSSSTNADYTGVDWAVDGDRTLQYVQRPMQRCNSFYLKVWSTTVGGSVNAHMEIEEIIAKVSASPERRIR